jgi:hypothetical protein
MSPNAGMTRSSAQSPAAPTTAESSSAKVSSLPVSAVPIASTTVSVWSAVILIDSGTEPPAGTAPSAAVHSGRSAAGNRCTVPRGPNVFTSDRSAHNAWRTAARPRPSSRRPRDTSAADITCACAPHIAAVAATGSAHGDSRPCRDIRRAHTVGQASSRMCR